MKLSRWTLARLRREKGEKATRRTHQDRTEEMECVTRNERVFRRPSWILRCHSVPVAIWSGALGNVLVDVCVLNKRDISDG